jgi:hypothetical protein
MPRYRVFHLNRYLRTFGNRDDALRWIMKQCDRQDNYYFYEDFEILDGSDFL